MSLERAHSSRLSRPLGAPRNINSPRLQATGAAGRRPVWWEPAYVKTVLGAEERPLTPLFFDINIERITGRRGSGA